MTIKGIDVSSWNPQVYPTSGLDFVFVKATEGTSYVNPHMIAQAATARSAGLGLGFYHFLHGGSIKAQAAYFVDRCDSAEGDMLVCDWETPAAGARTASASASEKDAFLREVKRLRPGHKVGLYCNTDYWLHRDATSYCGDFLWIADPNHPAGKPGIKHAWTFHQYAITGGTDRDVAAFASRAQLRTWCGYPSGKPKPSAPAPTKDERQDAAIHKLEGRVTALERGNE